MRQTILAAAAAVLFAAGSAAASEAPKAPDLKWSFEGVFGTFDRSAVRRGLQVYTEVCSACHSLNLVAYRHLAQVGFTEAEIKSVATKAEITDGPNEEGEMFTRPGRPADTFKNPFENPQMARAANGGALPPDLSVVTKARKNGFDYIHAMLTGYKEQPPQGFTLIEGANYNEYFPGHQIKMPPPLSADMVTYPDGTKATVDQMATDVVSFLAWAAEPELEARKRLGIKAMLFLLILTAMLYALKRKIWSDLH